MDHVRKAARAEAPRLSGSKPIHSIARSRFAITIAFILHAAPLLTAAEPVRFDTQIQPIFESRCYACHGPEKQKAKLRLDSPEAILKGTPDGPVIVPGKAEDSLLYQRISLPPDDDDIMPPEDGPLTAAQIALIQAWISQGAAFGAATSQPATAIPQTQPSDMFEMPMVPPGDPAAIEKLREAGAWVAPLGGGSHLLSVSLRHHTGLTGSDSAAMELLAPLHEQIAWLDLGHSDVSDAALPAAGNLKNLIRLNLEKTAVSDPGLANLQALTGLRYLNLYGTRVTDAGLNRLEPLAKLQQLYLWQTEVTDAGVADLCRAIPKLRVYRAATTAPADPDPSPATTPAEPGAPSPP